jgi:hypothetical protein
MRWAIARFVAPFALPIMGQLAAGSPASPLTVPSAADPLARIIRE